MFRPAFRPTLSLLLSMLLISALATFVAACGKGPAAADKNAAVNARPLLISPEDVFTVRSSALASGPTITGTVQPERRADLRAEIQALVLQVLKENGDAVRRGDLHAGPGGRMQRKHSV